MTTIVIQYVHPPIPDRSFDYCAYIRDMEGWAQGYGATAAQALRELANLMEDFEEEAT